jgi:formylglycine-generating enzyme required for sulfatase activity
MKHTLLIALTIIFAATAISFSVKPFNPPGTVKINDTLYYDEAEVSNFAWREYLSAVGKQYGYDSEQYKFALPDTLVWRHKLSYNEPYVEYYFRHPAYSQFPVVGISFRQANEYCKWRTDVVKGQLKKMNPGKTYVFEYRLPDRAEWQSVALIGLSNKTEKRIKSKNMDKNYIANLRYGRGHTGATEQKEHADVTRPAISGFPNEKSIYNIFGNVAEMTKEKGISVGGGWTHTADEAGFHMTINYEKPESWLGFRCVCVVKNP